MYQKASITISSLEQLTSKQQEIVDRINAFPNGGRLLLVDPLRLIKQLNVHLSDEVIQSWNKLSGGAFDHTGKETAYDDLLNSKADYNKVNIKVRQLLKPTYTYTSTTQTTTDELT
jgi:hypothetical protein